MDLLQHELDLDVKPGGVASLDEFAAERFDTWQAGQDRAREVQQILRKRYPKAGVHVCCVPVRQWAPVGSPGRAESLQRQRLGVYMRAKERLTEG